MGNMVWKVMSTGAGIGAAQVARRLNDAMWHFIRGEDAPRNPEDPDIAWREAVGYALMSGAIVGVVRMLASRQAAVVYRRSAGHLPEPLQQGN